MFGCISIRFFSYNLITNAGLQGQNHPESQWIESHLRMCKFSSNSDLGSTEEPDSFLLTFVFAAPGADKTGDRQFLLRFSFSAF